MCVCQGIESIVDMYVTHTVNRVGLMVDGTPLQGIKFNDAFTFHVIFISVHRRHQCEMTAERLT